MTNWDKLHQHPAKARDIQIYNSRARGVGGNLYFLWRWVELPMNGYGAKEEKIGQKTGSGHMGHPLFKGLHL